MIYLNFVKGSWLNQIRLSVMNNYVTKDQDWCWSDCKRKNICINVLKWQMTDKRGFLVIFRARRYFQFSTSDRPILPSIQTKINNNDGRSEWSPLNQNLTVHSQIVQSLFLLCPSYLPVICSPCVICTKPAVKSSALSFGMLLFTSLLSVNLLNRAYICVYFTYTFVSIMDWSVY